MRLGWTPRRLDNNTGQWTDEPSCFATVKCYRRLAENAGMCLHKGEPVLVTGTMRLREYEAKDGSRRTNIDIFANSIGHDLSRGASGFRRFHGAAGAVTDPGEGAENAARDGQEPDGTGFGDSDDAADDYSADDLAADADDLAARAAAEEQELSTASI
jgi:single-strand DNA-binding protein